MATLFFSDDEEDLFGHPVEKAKAVPVERDEDRGLLFLPDDRPKAARPSSLFDEECDDLFPPPKASRATMLIPEAVERLQAHDPLLHSVSIIRGGPHTHAQLDQLADCLMAHPNQIASLWLCGHQLTDETGVKLARYLAASTTLRSLYLSNNHFGDATYLAVAAALRSNCSLVNLLIEENRATDRDAIDLAFAQALRLNPDRPPGSEWFLYDPEHDLFTADVDYHRLKAYSSRLGHATLQTLLIHLLLK